MTRARGSIADRLDVRRHPGGDGFATPDSPLKGGPAVETFRMTALSVEHFMATSAAWSVAVMGAWPKSRRPLISELLARALSELRPPVRLIEADPSEASSILRPVPTEHANGGSPTPPFERISVAGALAQGAPGLVEKVHRRMSYEIAHGHAVVIDLPPATTSALAFSLARIADAVLYVARPHGRQSDVHRQIRRQLDLLDVHILGVLIDES